MDGTKSTAVFLVPLLELGMSFTAPSAIRSTKDNAVSVALFLVLCSVRRRGSFGRGRGSFGRGRYGGKASGGALVFGEGASLGAFGMQSIFRSIRDAPSSRSIRGAFSAIESTKNTAVVAVEFLVLSIALKALL